MVSAEKLQDCANLSSKKWCCLAKSFFKKDAGHSSYPCLIVDSETICDNCENAQVFNEFFLESSRLDDQQIPKPDATCNVERTLSHVVITERNLSLSSGIYPKSWKRANVVLIYKKNANAITDNYRPVSLLFERSVFKYVF